jgi:hypothetical protein
MPSDFVDGAEVLRRPEEKTEKKATTFKIGGWSTRKGQNLTPKGDTWARATKSPKRKFS